MNGNVNLLTHLAWLTGLWHKARVSSMMIILFQFFLSSEFPFPTPNHFDDELRIPIWDMSLSRLAEILRLWLFISIGLLLPSDKRLGSQNNIYRIWSLPIMNHWISMVTKRLYNGEKGLEIRVLLLINLLNLFLWCW